MSSSAAVCFASSLGPELGSQASVTEPPGFESVRVPPFRFDQVRIGDDATYCPDVLVARSSFEAAGIAPPVPALMVAAGFKRQ